MKKLILEAKNITKTFPGVIALDDINLDLFSHEVHAIIGENGAGKSTLVKCLTGIYTPSSGQVLINNQNIIETSQVLDKIAYVPQELNLFDNLTVAENLFMPFNMVEGQFVNHKSLVDNSIAVLDKFKLNIDPETLVDKISVSEKQMLQLARALMNDNFEVLILDEPTTSLTTRELSLFYDLINEQKELGKAIVFISHKLDELFFLSDVVSVFRNGKKVSFHQIDEVNEAQIVNEMTGKSIDTTINYIPNVLSNELLLEVKNFTGEYFENASFNLKKGEILGFAGLVGAGRSELMQALFGFLPKYSGDLILENNILEYNSPTDSVKNGIIYIPEERKAQGIFPHLSVKENISLALLNSLTVSGIINTSQENIIVNKVIDEYSVKTPNSEQEIQFLSGGNQQKVIIGRSMYSNPKVLIFDEPTKGIDVGTKAEIYRLMKELAEEKNVGIIMISSEIEEVIKCSNRIIAMHEGKIIREFTQPVIQDELMKSMLGIKELEDV